MIEALYGCFTLIILSYFGSTVLPLYLLLSSLPLSIDLGEHPWQLDPIVWSSWMIVAVEHVQTVHA